MLECDYLVVGAGASGLAFVDSLLARAQTQTVGRPPSIAIIDERDRPGGHWNDAYRFARLHHESAHYGVGSRKLEKPGKAKAKGGKAGGGHHATTGEVLVYYSAVMDGFLDTGCVQYFRRCTFQGDEIASMLDPCARWRVCRDCKIVDSTHLRVQAPSSRPPPFEVGLGAFVAPPNFLPSVSVPPSRFVVIGAGRTGVDSVLWLLRMGVKPARIQWVMPRDHWFMCREAIDGKQVMHTSIAFNALTLTCTSLEEHAREMERRGLICRLDANQKQECFHGAAVSREELEKLRSVSDVVRLGRVRAVFEDHLVLERGQISCPPGTLHVDCTANWIRELPDPVPIFQGRRILLQPVQEVLVGAGEFSVPCGAALLGFLEGMFPEDDEKKNSFCTPGRYPDTLEDWLWLHVAAARNRQIWSHPCTLNWLVSDRLSLFSALGVEDLRQIAARSAKGLAPNLEKILKDGASRAPVAEACASEAKAATAASAVVSAP